MLVADTNIWIAYLAGEDANDLTWLDSAIHAESTRMLPMVLSELLSAPTLASDHANMLQAFPLMELADEYWSRVGLLRASLQAKRYRPRLVDTMIAQLCIDHDAILLTRDAGFSRFVQCGLRLHK